jgi:hypothetical protein
LEAIQNLTGCHAGLSFPKPSAPGPKSMAAAAGTDYTSDYSVPDVDEDDGYGDEFGDEEDEN